MSLEPDSNQWPKDICLTYYSPPLYQLSYRGIYIKLKKYHNFKNNLKFECNWGTNFAQRFQSGFNSNSFRIVCFTKSCISIISQQFSLNWDTIHLGRCLRVSIELNLVGENKIFCSISFYIERKIAF